MKRIIVFLLLVLALPFAAHAEEGSVNVYSYRAPALIEPLFAAFEKKTGVVVNVLFAKRGLVERIALEGPASPADILLTTDIGQLVQAAQSVARPVRSSILESAVPALWRDPNRRWFGLSLRARAAFMRKEAASPARLTYESLGTSQWSGRLCMRDGQHPYNIALTSAMIGHHGANETRRWLTRLKHNLARRPAGNDRAQLRLVQAGGCDLAIANTYYLGKMLTNENQPEQKKWAESLQIVFPVFEEGGVHVNISGMVMTRAAPHPKAALALMEFLVSEEAQKLYAEANFEYPVNPSIAPAPLVKSWGDLRPDTLSLAVIAGNRSEASLLTDETRFND